jgi:ligand-binding SRPBCC domain-containing protein
MPQFRITTRIKAPIELCFDLARDIDFHTKSLSATEEQAVGGHTSGLIELGEAVTWEARHFGIRQRFTSKITAFDRPHYFQDSMIAGAFREFVHDHRFEARDDETRMIDEVYFRSPFGPIGRFADWLFLERYMQRLLDRRAMAIKHEAESQSHTTNGSDIE